MVNDDTLVIRQATPEDTPVIVRLLADNFQGKFAIALGSDAITRARRMVVLLPLGILCQGYVYASWLGEVLAASFTLKTSETIPSAEDYRRARQVLQVTDGWWRALWATTVLRLFSGPKLGPDDCYLDNLVTARALQHQGIATHIASVVYEEARKMGKSVILADVMSSNYRVVGLFKKEGWDIIRHNYWFAPITWPLLGTPGFLRIRKHL